MSEEKVNDNIEKDSADDSEGHLVEKLEGVGQVIIGELELIGGALTGDPLTQAEGEFNVEAGTLEAEVASALEESEASGDGSEEPK